jgi:3-deoxy-7-phosphoheptulonate synthase
MLLKLSSPDLLPTAQERLTALGLEHFALPGSAAFEVRAENSIFSPAEITRRLGDLGNVIAPKSRTPLLDALGPDHAVNVKIPGGPSLQFQNFQAAIWIAGPCSLDEMNDVRETARRVSELGVKVLRGGAVKPRTSPHEFQGMGRMGYRLLASAAHEFGMAAISEALSEDDVAEAAEFLDIIQIGARNMQNFALLKKLGKTGKPVMLKRNAGASLKEWAAAAEYLLSEGNKNIILCERGVRGLERELRYTLDLAGAAFMQQRYGLPVVIDPSHATGIKQILEACTAGAIAMGFAGVMLETHPRPVEARSDSLQALDVEGFAAIARRHLRAPEPKPQPGLRV